jgi:hypothetical protein
MNTDNVTKSEIKYKQRKHSLLVQIQHNDISCKYSYSCFLGYPIMEIPYFAENLGKFQFANINKE